MQVKTAPKFVRIAGSHTDAEAGVVKLLMQDETGEHYALQFHPGIVAPVVTAILGEANSLVASRPDLAPMAQPMFARGMSAAMGQDGQLALKIQLEGTIQLLLTFRPEDIVGLQAQLADLREILDRTVQ